MENSVVPSSFYRCGTSVFHDRSCMDVTLVEVPTLSRVLDYGRSSRACAVSSSVRLPVLVIFNARTDVSVKDSDRMRVDCAWRWGGGGLERGPFPHLGVEPASASFPTCGSTIIPTPSPRS